MNLPATDNLGRQSLADELAERLRSRLTAGEFLPGQKLPTGSALARHYGVSMSVVREALSQLKNDGLIHSVQGVGAFVSAAGRARSFRLDTLPGTDLSLARIFELRRGVEGEAAWLAARRRTPDQLGRLQSSLDAMADAVARGEDGTAADAQFHHLLAEATGNPLFLDMYRFLAAHIATAIEMARLNSARQGLWHGAHQEHEVMLAAVRAREPEAAREAMWHHIQGAARRLGLATD